MLQMSGNQTAVSLTNDTELTAAGLTPAFATFPSEPCPTHVGSATTHTASSLASATANNNSNKPTTVTMYIDTN